MFKEGGVGRLDGPKYMSVVSQTEPQHDFAGTIYYYIYNISGWNKREFSFVACRKDILCLL